MQRGRLSHEKRRFRVVTYGCQMNIHDSEKLSNLLYHAGFAEAEDSDDAELLVINTCSIRDKAESRLYSDLGRLGGWKRGRAGRVLGVGGCVAQQQGDALLARFPQLDFVFGTHNLQWVPAMVEAALEGERSTRTAETSSSARFDLPDRHPGYAGGSPGRAFVTVMEGCDMFCSFCIVPKTRGREISRPAASILEEARGLADRGIHQITLLGQTVNAYGRHDLRRGRAEANGTLAFAELLARLDAIPGLDRIHYISPHPLFFDDELVRAHGELASLCPHVHLPLQSGSTAVLEKMRRRYTREQFLTLPVRLRACRPDIAITTDIIVGFPGETRTDFEQTLSAVAEAGFVDCYSFKYSPRPGTAALSLGAAVPADEAQERLVRLQQLQRELTLDYHRSRVGTRTRILVEGASRKGGEQLRGRDPYHRVVNVAAQAVPGDLLEVEIVEATPHSLIGVPVVQAGRPAGSFDLKQKERIAEENGRSALPERGDPLRVV